MAWTETNFLNWKGYGRKRPYPNEIMQNINELVVIYGREMMASGDKIQKNGVVHEL